MKRLWATITAVLLAGSLGPVPVRAGLYRPFFVWTSHGIVDENAQTLEGENPLDPEWTGETGDLVQIISTGPDGLVSPADNSGNPTGDDEILVVTAVGVGFPWGYRADGHFCYLFGYPLDDGDPGIYARVFNAPTLENAYFYGNSTVFSAASTATDDFDVYAAGLTETDVQFKATVVPTATPTPTPSATPTVAPTATATPEIVPPTPAPSPSPSAALSPTPDPTPSTVPTASVTPTPAYCAAPFEVAVVEDLRIAHPRASAADGWSWNLTRAEDPEGAGYGTVADNANSFTDQGAFLFQPAAVLIRPGAELPDVREGDYLQVTYDDGRVLNVYPPAVSTGVDVYYYIGSDGSTYNDRWLCDLAKAAVSPTPSATVTPDTGTPTTVPATATPTPTPSSTPTAAAPSPTPTIIGCLAARGEVRFDTGAPAPGGAWVRLVFADGASAPVEVAPDGSYLATGCTHLPDGPVRVEARAPGCFPWYSQTDYRDWDDIEGVTVELSVLPGRVGIASADFDRSGYPSRAFRGDEDDIAVFRPGTGQWLVRGVTRIYFGREYDTLVSADYNGDGVAEAAVFRGENGLWAIRGLTRLYYGGFMDIPVPADYDGDGTAEPGIYRHTTGLWAYRGAGRTFHGETWDFPVVWRDGRGSMAVPAVYRSASALWYVQGLTRVYFGRAGDVPIAGAYAETEEYVPAVFRPGSGRWLIRGVTGFYFGQEGDNVFPMKDTSGDRPAVFRDEKGRWFIRGVTAVNYGRQGDQPVAR